MDVEAKSPEIQPEKRESWRGRIGLPEVLLAFVAYLAIQFAGSAVIFGVLGYELGSSAGTLLGVAIAALAPILAAGLAVVVRRRNTLASVGLRRVPGRWLLIGAGVGLLAWLVNRGIVLLYVWITGDASNPQAGLANAAAGGTLLQLALLVLLGGLLVPFGEELLFRGVLFTWLRRWGLILAVAISAAVFGLFHGVNVVLPAAILLGIFNALLYNRSGSIWPAVTAHAVNNTLIFVLVRVVAELFPGALPG